MKEVTLITCVSSKKREKLPAKDLYDSPYFGAMRRYAESRGYPWFILSAKHGLLEPDTVIDPYDERGLTVEQSKEIAASLSEKGVETLRLTGGTDYTDTLVPELELEGIDVIEVCRGMGIGERMAELNTLANSLDNEVLSSYVEE